jgi:gliding motility-associated-like protein
MKSFVLLVWLLLLLAGAGPALAQAVLVCSLSDLYRLDLQTCRTTLIGRMPTLMNDIALTPTGLYGVSGNYGNPALAQTLFRIDPATGSGTAISRLDYTINGLVAGPDGTLYGAGAFGELVIINPVTGAVRLLGNMGFPCQGDLAFFQDRLFMAATGNRLVEVNLRNPAQSRLIGTLGIGSEVLGLVTVGVQTCTSNTLKLYGTGGSGLYEIDPLTGAVRPVCTYSLATIDGAASPIETTTADERPAAGLDSAALVCAGVRSVRLGQYLFRADPGGVWRVAAGNGQLTGNIYTPGNTNPARLEYIVGTGNCRDTAVIRLTFQPLPRVTGFVVTPTGCSYADGQLRVSGEGFQPLRYALDSTAQGVTVPVFTNLSLQTYTVFLTDGFGCRGQDTVSITNGCIGNLYLPTAFSPNGDQLNDLFVAQLSEGDAWAEQFAVYDRWGRAVYARADFALRSGDALWDGLVGGAAADGAVYSYRLRLRYRTGYRHTFAGSVAVVR